MTKVDKHGLIIKGLKQASGKTHCQHYWAPFHTEIFYNTETGTVWTIAQYGDNFTHYDDPKILRVADTAWYLTMQNIADAIYQSVEDKKHLDKLWEEWLYYTYEGGEQPC